nr:MAG TPA: hypothetical protein [Caudoviricetes sp.]
MDEQVRSAKAVVDIDEVHLYKHTSGEPEITQTLLDNKQDWFSVATLKGSVEVTQDALSLTKINIDQSNMPIGISTEPGDFNINFSMPAMVLSNLKNWMANNSEDSSYTKLKLGNKEGYGYDFNAELTEAVLAIKAKTGEWFVFPNIQGSVFMKQEDKVWVLGFSGMVLGASNEKNNDVYILSETETSAPGVGG